MQDEKNFEMQNYLPERSLQILSRTFFGKIYILCYDFKY